MSLSEIREEYRSVRIGPKILSEVRNSVHQVCRRYDPQIYGRAASWDDAEEDLVQAVVLDLLLQEGQLDYLMARSVQLEDFQNLLRFQVKRYLARQRQRSVVDNLLDRSKELLQTGAFQSSGKGQAARYSLAGAAIEGREPTEEEVAAAARSVALVPRIRFAERERAPTVYTRENLETLLQAVGISLPAGFSLHDLARILELVLTDWVVGFLYDFEGAQVEPSAGLNPEETTMVEAAAREIVEQCTPEHLLVLRRKLENLPDQAIADELGVSRPTVIARKKEAYERMRGALEDLPEHVQAAVVDRLAAHLATFSGGGRL